MELCKPKIEDGTADNHNWAIRQSIYYWNGLAWPLFPWPVHSLLHQWPCLMVKTIDVPKDAQPRNRGPMVGAARDH